MPIMRIEWLLTRKGHLLKIILMGVILFSMMALYPTMSNEGIKQISEAKFTALPPELLKIFNLEDIFAVFQFNGFFAYIYQYLFLASGAFAIMMGGQLLIKEETDGSIEYLYAQPVSRYQIISYKAIFQLLMLALYWLSQFIVSIIAMLLFLKPEEKIGDALVAIQRVFIWEFLILVMFFSIGLVISTVIHSSKQVTGITLGVVFGSYLFGIVAELQETLEFLKYLSPLHFALPTKLLNNNLEIPYLVITLVVTFGCFGLTALLYNRKDLKG